MQEGEKREKRRDDINVKQLDRSHRSNIPEPFSFFSNAEITKLFQQTSRRNNAASAEDRPGVQNQ